MFFIKLLHFLGVVEKSVSEAVDEMAKGVEQFLAKNPTTSLESITFVVYNDTKTQSLLQKALE